MVLDAVSNFVRGETDAAVDSTQTTVSVVDASIFPDPATDGEYNVVIWDVDSHPRPDQDADVEILRVTAVDTGTNDLTVTRGQETTTGASHPSGSAVHLSPTAKMFGDIESTFGDFWDAGAQELTADVNNQSVSTDNVTANNSITDPLGGVINDALLAFSTAGKRAESGSVTWSSSISAAPDDGWDSVQVVAESQTFSSAFAATPQIFGILGNTATRGNFSTTNVSTTGFDAQYFQYSTNSIPSDTATADWFAVGDD